MYQGDPSIRGTFLSPTKIIKKKKKKRLSLFNDFYLTFKSVEIKMFYFRLALKPRLLNF